MSQHGECYIEAQQETVFMTDNINKHKKGKEVEINVLSVKCF